MKRLPIVAFLVATASSAHAQGERAASLDVLKWYNTPPISAERLQSHAVLVEVFRTW